MRALILEMALGSAFCFALPAGSQTTAVSPHQLYDSLNGVRVDPAAVYPVKQVELFRADVKLTFEEGTLGFLTPDRKSTRLNSSHGYISYAVFCLKKKKKKSHNTYERRQSTYRHRQ